jgi:hypothetical protein
MAKRKRSRGLAGLGAVAKNGSSYRGRGRSFTHGYNVRVSVERDIGASTARQYQAHACVVARGKKRAAGYDRRCGVGSGRTPTAASKKALRRLSTNLK